ncbi:MAG: hypothetical protein ACRCSP_06000 [Rhodoglobus sp.]
MNGDAMLLLAGLVAETEKLAPLLLPPIIFALIAAIVFVFLGFVVWSFRDVAHRQGQNKGATDSYGAHH